MSVFKEETIKSIIKKAQDDESGYIRNVIKELMKICEDAGKAGFNMDELSVICTTGWYVSQDPVMAELMKIQVLTAILTALAVYPPVRLLIFGAKVAPGLN